MITDHPEHTFDDTEDVAYELDYASGFRAFLTPVEFSPGQVEEYLRLGDPFLQRVLEEGKVLYDDGTLRRIREQVVAARA